jgi:hypothetical protein
MTARKRKRGGSPKAPQPPNEQKALARLLQEDKQRRQWRIAPTAEELDIDRRRLSAFLDGTAKSIRFEDLSALSKHLAKGGLRLSQIFESPSLIDALAKSRRIAFLIGAKPERPGPGTSWWDLRSLSETIQSLNNSVPQARPWELYDVLEADDPTSLSPDRYAEQLHRADWLDLLADDSEFSVLSFGSPIANHATEVMLAHMYGVPPFSRDVSGVPFQFVWSDTRYDERPSSFAIRGTQRAQIDHGKMSSEWNVWGIDVGGELHLIDRHADPALTFGVIAAQRRRGGQVWAVLAGATGPGTYAASTLLTDHPGPPDGAEQGEHSRTCWIPIQANERGSEARKTQTVSNATKVYGDNEAFLWPG